MKKQYAFIGLVVSGGMFSQTVKDSIASKGIEDVVIVASRKPTKISEVPGTVWVVQKEKIREQAKSGVPIKEMLSILIPSMDIGPQGRTNFRPRRRRR